MSETSNTLLSSWLKLLCGMIPGIAQAIVLVNATSQSTESSDTVIKWPVSGSVHDDLLSSAKQSLTQNKKVTTMLSDSVDSSTEKDVDMIIATPLPNVGTVAIFVRVKPSQQFVVMQILKWGENWLKLLLQQPRSNSETFSQPEVKSAEIQTQPEEQSFFAANRTRIAAGSVMVFVILMSVLTGTYRVTAPANLEGKIQRAIVAPFDGYIANAFVRAGEIVKNGDSIAEMDSESLKLEQQRYTSERNEYTKQYRQALAVRDKAQAHIFKSKVKQAEAKLELLELKVQRSTLTAPIDGVVISGDLSRSLGAPVSIGDVLFEVAPLDEYRLIILVDEDQVVDVQKGLHGRLNLTALPTEKIEFVVQKVSPVFEEDVDGIVYRVEAIFNETYPALRPGMQGVAKIDIDERSFAWIYLHQLFDAVRLWFWSWLP